MGSDQQHQRQRGQLEPFQFTLPRGERPSTYLLKEELDKFQFTLPRGERLVSTPAGLATPSFQFTLPRGERPTEPREAEETYLRFNSRSRVGSDNRPIIVKTRTTGFNSRSRVGSDCLVVLVSRKDGWFQFTLPRGERPSALWPMHWLSVSFNSRSRVGSDRTTAGVAFVEFLFQFTLPRGERHAKDRLEDHGEQFQFTLPRGERPTWNTPPSFLNNVSIHAPAWGATLGPGRGGRQRQVSIHAPAWGATKCSLGYRRALRVSIHAPAWGATKVHPRGINKSLFQFTLPRGERPPPVVRPARR